MDATYWWASGAILGLYMLFEIERALLKILDKLAEIANLLRHPRPIDDD